MAFPGCGQYERRTKAELYSDHILSEGTEGTLNGGHVEQSNLPTAG